MENKNYYDIFDLTEEDKKLSKDKFDSKLKKAFRSSSKKFHPDIQHNKSEEEKLKAEENFKIINEAYSVLGDENKRQLYDRFGKDLGKSQGHGQQHHGGFQEDDLQDLINQHFNGGFGGRGRQQDPRTQAHLRVTVDISLEDAYSDKTKKKTFKYNRNFVCDSCGGLKFDKNNGGRIEVCPSCNGQRVVNQQVGPGMFMQTPCGRCSSTGTIIINGCKTCNSSGLQSKNETIDIDINPASVFNNIQVPNKGNEILVNGNKFVGDLIIQVKPLPHKDFQLDQQGNLHKVIEISVLDCILGKTNQTKFKHIDGSEKQFKLNYGTKEGETFRLGGLGIPTPSGQRTDLHLHISQKYPSDLSDKEIDILTDLKDSKNFKK